MIAQISSPLRVGFLILALSTLRAQAPAASQPPQTPAPAASQEQAQQPTTVQPAAPPTQTAAPVTPAQQAAQPATPVATPAPGPDQQSAMPPTESPLPLRVLVGKSLLINTADRLKRVSVTDPTIADALVVTPTQVLIHGRGPGEVSLVLWNQYERSKTFDLRVDLDTTAAQEAETSTFPGYKINVASSRNALILSGHVDTKEDAERAVAVATGYTKNVINAITYGLTGSEQVLLEVKFIEIDRTALTQAGLNLFSTGAGKLIGSTTTQQFGTIGSQTITDIFGGGVKNSLPFTTTQTVSPLNVFLFRPDIHLGTILQALQQKNVLEILAEPNLVALNGKDASFLAGGEFPIPVAQGSTTGAVAVTILFKEFGVKLKFTPSITPNGDIRMHVAPEVSALDFAAGVQINGFNVPGLTTRRAETELQMQDGQSFVMAGLLDNRVRDNLSKLPGVSSVPVLGNLFKSKDKQKTQTELMVMVTAHKILPTTEQPKGPAMPEPLLDKGSFDKRGGGK